jgi:hypothetical protein
VALTVTIATPHALVPRCSRGDTGGRRALVLWDPRWSPPVGCERVPPVANYHITFCRAGPYLASSIPPALLADVHLSLGWRPTVVFCSTAAVTPRVFVDAVAWQSGSATLPSRKFSLPLVRSSCRNFHPVPAGKFPILISDTRILRQTLPAVRKPELGTQRGGRCPSFTVIGPQCGIAHRRTSGVGTECRPPEVTECQVMYRQLWS